MARILVVDDSATDVHALCDILERNGFNVSSAESGEEGVAKARDEQPDLVLMDVVMPGMNGFQATRQITKQAETADIPVILVTTKDQETDRIWGMRQGAREYLTKPIDEAVLLSAIKRAIPSL